MPRKAVSPEVLERLVDYRWPGNVRDLRNVLERMYFLSGSEMLETDDLPAEIRRGEGTGAIATIAPLREAERAHIMKALQAAGGNKSRTAELLGIDRKTLYAKIKNYSLETG